VAAPHGRLITNLRGAPQASARLSRLAGSVRGDSARDFVQLTAAERRALERLPLLAASQSTACGGPSASHDEDRPTRICDW
jgi:hypothetical protein